MRPRLVLCCGLALLLGGASSDVARRSLLYPRPGDSETKVQVLFGLGLPMEGQTSMTLGYVVKCNYDLPYNASRSSRGAGAGGATSRWSLYGMLAAALGKSCLLRAVCEAAELPLASAERGLAGQLVRLLLAPSATRERYELYADREYHAAEAKGRGGDCSHFRRDCNYSLLDYFTRVVHA